MFARVFWPAIFAGLIAGAFLFIAHATKTTPMILQAEVYESGEGGDQHAVKQKSQHTHAQEHSDDDADFGEAIVRHSYTLLTDILTSVGFAFLLVGAIALRGEMVSWKQGMLWGACGYAAFFVAPSFGLAPELPGMQSAALEERQIWWLGTAVATAAGLALIFLTDKTAMRVIGAVLIIVPHVIGAPVEELETGDLPAELAAQFAVTTLVISGLFWLLLGGLSGYLYGRSSRSP